MKTKSGFAIRPLGREFILTAEGLGRVNFNKMISLNSTAAYLWKAVEGKEFSEDDLVKLLLDEYEVEEAVAREDVKKLVASWTEAELIEA